CETVDTRCEIRDTSSEAATQRTPTSYFVSRISYFGASDMGLMIPQASDTIQELSVEELRAKVGTGMEIADAEEHMLLSMGPQHPSTHGVLRLLVELDGETVVNLAPDIGFLHTGIEKSMESKRYTQALVMTDRMDYLSPMTNNMCYIMAVEKL